MELLAKSDPPITLLQHIKDGLRILDCLKACFPKTPEIAGAPAFWEWLRLCVIFHDTGKAHAEFQKLLRMQADNNWDRQRHELFSLSFVHAYLEGHEACEKILRVVAGHHKTINWLHTKELVRYPQVPENETFESSFLHVDSAAIVEMLEHSFGLVNPKVIRPFHPQNVILPYTLERRIGAIKDRFQLLLMTGAFKQCDHLSSAFVDAVEPLPLDRFDFLDRKQKVLQAQGKSFFSHQNQAAQARDSLIVTAPTGSGKTETAMLWLRRQIQEYGQGRVFYVLPFTASINAMWERLKNETDGLGHDQVGMLHGNLDSILYEQLLAETGDVQRTLPEVKRIKETFQTLEIPFKVVTPFQLLKHIFGLKGFEKGVFEMAGGYFIFDEIHAYEPAVFAQIVVLLEFVMGKLGAKAMIMTATLPSFLKAELLKIADFNEISADDGLYKKFQRHRLKVLPGEIVQHYDKIASDLKAGQKVLIVCNTVLRAQEVYDEMQNFVLQSDRMLLHGAFNGEDRAAIEQRLKNAAPQLLVGTQAIEVSLDIDYDVIYTELAPLDALLQRFGRVNRHRFWNDGPRLCWVCAGRNTKDKYVYSNSGVIENTLTALYAIESQADGIIHEQQLQSFIDMVYPDFSKADRETFDTTRHYLHGTVFDDLAPMEQSSQSEEDFYKQFDGEKVLPVELRSRFVQMLNEFNFTGAFRLQVSIRKGEVARWTKTGVLELKKHVVETKGERRSKPLEFTYWVLNLPYSKELGLQKNAEPLSFSFFEDRIL